MNRRSFLAGSLSLLAAPLAAEAQQAGKVYRIGYLAQGSADRDGVYLDALRQGLRDFGWVEGQNIAIDARFAEGRTDLLPSLAAELVRRKVDIILTWTTPAALAAKQATTAIPIVIGGAADPVGSGVVASLARQRAVEPLHGVAFVGERLLDELAGAGVENGDLLRSRVQITSDEYHDRGLLFLRAVALGLSEGSSSARPFS